jgi:glyceraldehyde 3-phosphate dehydrogenase
LTPNVSLVDLVVEVEKETTAEDVNKAFKEASENDLKGILGYSEEPLVSIDYVGETQSGVVDALSTNVKGNNLVKVLGWYDNEWGYSERTADLVEFVIQKGL